MYFKHSAETDGDKPEAPREQSQSLQHWLQVLLCLARIKVEGTLAITATERPQRPARVDGSILPASQNAFHL